MGSSEKVKGWSWPPIYVSSEREQSNGDKLITKTTKDQNTGTTKLIPRKQN